MYSGPHGFQRETPERLTIPAGQTELLFSIAFRPVNSIDDIERPKWVESARSQ